MSRARPKITAILATCVTLLSIPALASAADVEALEDGGFERSECGIGDFGCSSDIWETTSTFSFCQPFECPGRPDQGRGWALAGGFELQQFGFTNGSLAQTAPVYTYAGQPLARTLSFRLFRPSPVDGVTASISVSIGGDQLAQLNTTPSRPGYQTYSYDPPDNESGRVSFFYSCENTNGYEVRCPGFLIDDVSLTYDGPVLEITKSPKKQTSSTSARFEFEIEDSQPATSLECRLDGGEPRPCVSPRVYRNLKPGRHRFTVQSTAGTQLPLPVSYSWTVKKKRRRG